MFVSREFLNQSTRQYDYIRSQVKRKYGNYSDKFDTQL